MPLIYVCPKSQVPDAARQLRPSHLITLLDPTDDMPTPEEVSGQGGTLCAPNDRVKKDTRLAQRPVIFSMCAG